MSGDMTDDELDTVEAGDRREEHHRAVLGEQVRGHLGQVEKTA